MLRRRTFLSCLIVCCFFGTVCAAEEESGRHWLSRIRLVPGEHERSHNSVKAAFSAVVTEATKSTVRVLSDGSQVALGTIVHGNGYVVTKASELGGESLECHLADGRRLEASLMGVHPNYDLALLKLPAKGLPAAKWAESQTPAVGSWLATTSLSKIPTAIGIASTAARRLPKPRAILGVGLQRIGQRTRVNRVFPGSAAAKAGLKVGDVIKRIDDQTMKLPQEISAAIRQMLPGDRVALLIERGDETLTIPAVLGDAARLGNEKQAKLMESLGGPLSQRRNGFPYVLQHDTVLRPKQCGGPLVDLDGKVVGINIARVSRVATYAIPADRLQPVLAELMAGEHPPADETVVLKAVSAGE